MIGMKKLVPAFPLASFLAGCAHVPDVTVGYYLPKSAVSFKVIRTVACDADDNPIIATAVTPTVKHSADPAKQYRVSLSQLKGGLSDSDVKFEFYEDGRLSAINASSTGQGEAILKTAITLATVVFAFDGGRQSHPKECAAIKAFGGGKPLTLTYEGDIDLTQPPASAQPLKPDTASTYYASALAGVMQGVYAFVVDARKPDAPASYSSASGNVVVRARQPGAVRIKVTIGKGALDSDDVVWNDFVPVAQAGIDYDLPIPKPAAFGKEAFAATFAESGALKSVQYARNTGAGQALNVASAGLTALQGDSAAAQAANVKAEADLIAQQQRLVSCIANPSGCK